MQTFFKIIDSGKLAKLTEHVVIPVANLLQNTSQLVFCQLNGSNVKLQR